MCQLVASWLSHVKSIIIPQSSVPSIEISAEKEQKQDEKRHGGEADCKVSQYRLLITLALHFFFEISPSQMRIEVYGASYPLVGPGVRLIACLSGCRNSPKRCNVQVFFV